MNSERTLASVPRRIATYGLDIGIVFVALLAFQALLYPVNPLLRATAASGITLHAWVTLTVSLPVAIFFGLSWGSPSGATPGMRLTRLRVRGAEGERVPYARALLRGVVLLAPFELNHFVLFYPQPIWDAPSPGFRSGFLAVYAFVLLYLAATLWTPRRQGPHDLAARTIVIRR